MSLLRVALIDDHRSFAEALSGALGASADISVIGNTTAIADLVRLAVAREPDVILVDYQLTEGTGLDCIARLLDEGVDARFILLTAYASPDVTIRALAAGFERTLSKEASLDDIIAAVRVPGMTVRMNCTTSPVRLSRRQRQVLELMGQGMDPSTIADTLFISVHTARSHVKDVLRSLNASTQLSAVTKAMRQGLLLPPTKNDEYA